MLTATQNQEIKHPKRRGHSSHHANQPIRRKEVKVPPHARRSTPTAPRRPLINPIHRRSTAANPSPQRPPTNHLPSNHSRTTSTLATDFPKVLRASFRRSHHLQLPPRLHLQRGRKASGEGMSRLVAVRRPQLRTPSRHLQLCLGGVVPEDQRTHLRNEGSATGATGQDPPGAESAVLKKVIVCLMISRPLYSYLSLLLPAPSPHTTAIEVAVKKW